WRPSYTRDGVKYVSKHWWFEYRIDGRRFRVNTKKTDKRSATIESNRILDAAERGETASHFTGETHPYVLVAEYEKELLRRGRSKKHVNQTGVRLRALLAGAEHFDVVTSEFARKALARVADRGDLSGKTVND